MGNKWKRHNGVKMNLVYVSNSNRNKINNLSNTATNM